MLPFHPSAEVLRRFVSNTATRQEKLTVVSHLLRGCDRCAALTASLLNLRGRRDEVEAHLLEIAPPAAGSPPDAAAADRLLGWGQWASLEALAHQQRLAAIRTHPRLQHRGLFEELLRAAKLERRESPRQAVEIVDLALELTRHLTPPPGRERELAGLRSRAWAELCVAQRMAGDFTAARAAIERAWGEQRRAPRSLPDRAMLHSFEASLLAATSQWRAAAEKVEEGLAIARQIHRRDLEGHLIDQAAHIWLRPDPERAVALGRQAIRIADPDDDRRQLNAWHHLATALTNANRPLEAAEVVGASRHLYQKHRDGYFTIRLHWLEARILSRLGHLTAAIRILEELWERFQRQQLRQGMEWVSIDLAWMYAKQGREDPGPPPFS